MPSTIRCVHPGSMPMTTTAATFGVAAGADHRAEEQFEVFAELQAAVRVRQRHRALDVVANGLGARRY
jgi:hypothetical protein